MAALPFDRSRVRVSYGGAPRHAASIKPFAFRERLSIVVMTLCAMLPTLHPRQAARC